LDRLEWIHLTGTPLTDAGLEQLAGHPSIKTLIIAYTQVTDAGLECVKKMPALEFLQVAGTSVTQQGIEALEQAQPGLKVAH
jgi:hypothetical protein